MARKGVVMYAKTDFDCLQCGTTLKAGERTPHQTLCSVGRNTRLRSPCQIIWYNKKKIAREKQPRFIHCDICHKKIKQETTRQVRCISPVEGELSECQIIAKKSISTAFVKKVEAKKKLCLKCGAKFPSKGDYNRICDSCSEVNSRMVRVQHKITVGRHN